MNESSRNRVEECELVCLTHNRIHGWVL